MTGIAAVKVMWLGTYERDYPRARVLIAGLREIGVEVVERHRPVWERERHKAGAFLRPLPLARAGGRFAAAWAGLAVDGAREPGVDAIVAGYPAQPDALPAWCVARARRVPLVVDMMISLADTLAGDRGRARARDGASALGGHRPGGRCARPTSWWPTRRPAPTGWPGASACPRARLAVVPVGAEPGALPAAPAPPGGPPTALFYGKLAPLHGVATVLEAARRPGAPAAAPDRRRPARALARPASSPATGRPGLSWERWVPYASLGAEVGRAAICLGVFGGERQGGPGRAQQGLAGDGRRPARRDRRHAAVREVLEDGRTALLVPAGDPDALAAALARLAADAALRERLGAAARAVYLERGRPRRWRRACATPSIASNLGGVALAIWPVPGSHDWGDAPELFGPRHDYREALIMRRLLPALPGPEVLNAGAGAGSLTLRLVNAGPAGDLGRRQPRALRLDARRRLRARGAGGQPGAARRPRSASTCRTRRSTRPSAPRCSSTSTTTGRRSSELRAGAAPRGPPARDRAREPRPLRLDRSLGRPPAPLRRAGPGGPHARGRLRRRRGSRAGASR